MKLIGMLDSPYVRRVAISFQLLGLRFTHQSLSVFRNFADFQQINPVVKAPTLICDSGTALMDSTLILAYAEAIARPRTLMPVDPIALQHALRVIGLALAACEKAVQIVYERSLRPPDTYYAPWVARLSGQLLAAFDGLEDALAHPLAVTSATINQAGISTAVAWQFTQHMLPELAPAANFPRLVAFSASAEALPEFKAAPHGDSIFESKGR